MTAQEMGMSLTGDFADFSLAEILRLVARTSKTGVLTVESAETEGRIHLEGGSITFAVTGDESALWRRLITGGLVTEAQIDAVKRGESDLTSIARSAFGDVENLLRDEIVENLYRFMRPRQGSFAFAPGEPGRPVTGFRFEPDSLFGDVERRAAEWAEIEEVVTDLKADLRLVPQIDEEATISAAMWSVIAAMGKKASVTRLSAQLGKSLFETARECARLVRAGVVEYAEEHKRRTPDDAGGGQGVDAGWWFEPDKEPSDDSDRFLESVFAELGEPEIGSAGGFPARRRLGLARDLTNPDS